MVGVQFWGATSATSSGYWTSTSSSDGCAWSDSYPDFYPVADKEEPKKHWNEFYPEFVALLAARFLFLPTDDACVTSANQIRGPPANYNVCAQTRRLANDCRAVVGLHSE